MGTFHIEHIEEGNRGAFKATNDGHPAGEMTYSRMNASTVIVDHTEVLPEFEGRHLGRELVEHGVAWARANGQRIMPLCPFALALFKRTPAYEDVWFR